MVLVVIGGAIDFTAQPIPFRSGHHTVLRLCF